MRTLKPLPALEEISKVLKYNEETGEFTWLINPSRAVKAGDKAGSVVEKGYIGITYKRQPMLAHRLAWLFSVGEDPGNNLIDHIDEDKTNNRIDNLRLIDNSRNVARSREPVCCTKQAWNGRYQAVYTLDGVKYYLGTYDTKEEASRIGREARKKARAL